MRRPLVAGNWKLHCGPQDAERLARDIRNTLLGSRHQVDVVLCPPFVSLTAVRNIVRDTPIGVGAQHLFWEDKGAWTGEVSAGMLHDAGCTHVIIGHSERRQHFGETNATVAKRLRAALKANLVPIVCIGETLAEREAAVTDQVVASQIREGLGWLSEAAWATVVLAYEPVWAIGTGLTATPEQAQAVHGRIRALVSELAGPAAAAALRIQYGGSVKAANAASLMAEPDVDGALVGGASLDASEFAGIVEAASR